MLASTGLYSDSMAAGLLAYSQARYTACRLGLRTLAIFSQADRLQPHRYKADESYLVGDPEMTPVQAYLDVEVCYQAIFAFSMLYTGCFENATSQSSAAHSLPCIIALRLISVQSQWRAAAMQLRWLLEHGARTATMFWTVDVLSDLRPHGLPAPCRAS